MYVKRLFLWFANDDVHSKCLGKFLSFLDFMRPYRKIVTWKIKNPLDILDRADFR